MDKEREKERQKERNRRYRETHLEELRVKQREFHKKRYAEDPEPYKARASAYRAAHPKEERERRRKYREAHREELKEWQRQYREEHKEELAQRRRMRDRLRQRGMPWLWYVARKVPADERGRIYDPSLKAEVEALRIRLRQERERRWAEAEERARQEEEELRDVLRSFGCKVD